MNWKGWYINMSTRTLIFNTHGETSADDAVITIAPHKIDMVAVTGEIKRNSKLVKSVTILLENGSSLQFYMTELDTFTLQQAIGAYNLG